MKKNDKFNDVLMYALLSPTIVDPRWPETPESLKFKALMHRILLAPKCVEERMATEFDALVYIHTVSLCVPLNRYWFRIYAYLFKKFLPKHAKTLERNGMWFPNELSDYERYLLDDLRRWIYKTQMRAIRMRLSKEGKGKRAVKGVITLDRWFNEQV